MSRQIAADALAKALAAELIDRAVRTELAEDELVRLRELERKLPEMVRAAYRRGYLTGRSAERRGAVRVTNPESTARGWIRELCAS